MVLRIAKTELKNNVLSTFVIKIAGACNLNCSYCYVYNKGDSSWKKRPPIMSDEIFERCLYRIYRHCSKYSQKNVTITFHGGEPCLIGSKKFAEWCRKAYDYLEPVAKVKLILQTNGTLINETWAQVLFEQDVEVGISMDGPRQLNDKFRIDHKGLGTYDAVVRGLKLLCHFRVRFGVLCVIQFGCDPLMVHHNFLKLGCKSINYIFPDYTHETIRPILERYGPTPCADFLIPIFDDWWFNGTMDIRIRNFIAIAKTILGGDSGTDTLGNSPLNYIMIETDGEIEGLDVLRICEDGFTKTGLNVATTDFDEIRNRSPFHSRVIFDGIPLPTMCRLCPEGSTCSGGYIPHRYSKRNGFNNPSVWCKDLLAIYNHIRKRLGVSLQDTQIRKEALHIKAISGY